MTTATKMASVASKRFSTEAAQSAAEKAIPTPIEDKKKEYRDPWGLKKSDEKLEFEK